MVTTVFGYTSNRRVPATQHVTDLNPQFSSGKAYSNLSIKKKKVTQKESTPTFSCSMDKAQGMVNSSKKYATT